MTITTLINRMVRRWCKSGIIEESDVDVYEYGLDLLLFTILNIAVVLVSAALISKLIESLTLLAVILPLQSFGGGYHAKTHLRCFLIMYIGWWVVILLLPVINPNPFAAFAVICFSTAIVFITAPVPHINVKMSKKRRRLMRRLVRITALAIAMLSLIIIWIKPDNPTIGIYLSTGLGVAAFSMLFAQCKNEIQQRTTH